MKGLQGRQTLMRIFISEHEKFEHKPLYKQILELLRKEKIAGATAIRGIAGFGAKSHMHSADILAISDNLPVIIEAVDSEDAINAAMEKIDPMISDGLITLEKVDVIRYAPK